jgi:hypothetical protein
MEKTSLTKIFLKVENNEKLNKNEMDYLINVCIHNLKTDKKLNNTIFNYLNKIDELKLGA